MNNQNIQTIYPLSPQQQGILFQTLVAEPGLYVEQTAAPINGSLNAEAFQRAWQRVIERHDVLRTAFVWKDQPEPLQVVLRNATVSVGEHDLRGASGPEQKRQIEILMQTERRRPFDLAKAPLMRLALVRTGEMSHHFIWTQHHILMDGWCVPIILDEFAHFYQSFCAGTPGDQPPAPQYREYIAWLKRRDPGAAERFWKQALSGFDSPTPLGKEDPSFQLSPEPERYGSVSESAGTHLTGALDGLARDHHMTLNTLMQGACALLLSRFSGRDDVVFGATVSGRPADLAGFERTIGLFMNTVPCRARVEPELSLREWLANLQSAQAEVRRFDYCSTGQIQDWTEVPGSVRLYDAVVVVENYPFGKRPDVNLSPRGQFVGAKTMYMLTLVVETGSDVRITAVYDSHRLERSAAQNIVQQILTVLNLFASQPESRVGDVLKRIPADRIPRIRVESSASESGGSSEEPQTPVEEQLMEVCGTLLGLKRVPMTQNFFALGGHSLLVTRLASRIRQDFDVDLPLRTFFDARTLRELAGSIEDAILRSVEDLTEEEAARLASKSSA